MGRERKIAKGEAAPGAQSLLRAAIAANEPEKALEAIEAGADPAAMAFGGRDALMLAAELGSLACLRLLLPRCDPLAETPREGATALMFAAASGLGPCVAALAPVSKVGASNSSGYTALMLAARSGSAEAAALLVEGSDISARSIMGLTAAEHAKAAGHEDLAAAILAQAKALRERGAIGKAVGKGSRAGSKAASRI